ncbi:MAG: pyrroline-5-carboxylate reductase [Flavisolibacter sp.]
MERTAIIGGGNLGTAIAEGILDSGFIQPEKLIITKRSLTTLNKFKNNGVEITSDNKYAIDQSKYIIIAVKPYHLEELLTGLKDSFTSGKIIISVVTGVWLKDIQAWVGNNSTIFRAMPNTAIAIRESMTCIAHQKASEKEVQFVKDLFEQLGKVSFIDEKLMDAATVLGACGTAFAMRYIRANIQGGIEIGFDAEKAAFIASQTIKGAAQLLLTHKTHPEFEIDKVTTPKGCTIAGLNEMEHQGFSSSLIKGLISSFKKINS